MNRKRVVFKLLALTLWFAVVGFAMSIEGLAVPHQQAESSNQEEKDDLKKFISETTRMKMTVKDEEGYPVPEAQVTVCAVATPRFGNRTYKTDEEGYVEFDRPKDVRLLRIWVTKDKYVPIFTHWEEEELAVGEQIPDSFPIVLPTGHRIGGTIVDENGKPIAGVSVNVAVSVPDPERSGISRWLVRDDDEIVTGDDGRWSIKMLQPNQKMVRILSSKLNLLMPKWSAIPNGATPCRTKS